jgi:hypothetical protein
MSLGESNQPEGRGVFLLKQSANIYTAMMILAFVFITIGCLFLFLEMKAYNLSVKVPPDAKVPQAMWAPAAQGLLALQGSTVVLNGISQLMDCQQVSIL